MKKNKDVIESRLKLSIDIKKMTVRMIDEEKKDAKRANIRGRY